MMLGGRLTEPVSPSTQSSAPCQASRPASVTTNDGMPNRVTMKPLKSPIATPTPSPATIAEQRRPAVLDAEHRHHRRRRDR